MNRIIDWDDQRIFLAVLQEGSLSGAARRLGVTQPTIRARLTALETALGISLFTRSVRGLVPTDQARALGQSARAMARASEAFVREAASSPGETVGMVRISVAEIVGIEVLPAMLLPLRKDHPGLALEIQLTNEAANLLEQEVDVAVRMHPPKQGALIARKVPSISLGLFAHADYLAERGTPRTLSDLASHDIIGPDRSRPDWDAVARWLPTIDPARVVIRTDSHPAQLAMARAGLGIAVAHRSLGLADARLLSVLPDAFYPTLDAWVVVHEDLRDVPRIRTVFDALVKAFERYGQEDYSSGIRRKRTMARLGPQIQKEGHSTPCEPS